MSAAMRPVTISGANVLLQSTYNVASIGTFSNGPDGPLRTTRPTDIFAHLDLPVWDSVALWLDAADPATIGLSATRGAGGFSQVSTWFDKSSNTQHLFQTTVSNQPYYHPTGFNGRPGVRFGYNTGITSLGRSGNFMVGNSEMTCFLVYRNEGRVGDQSRFIQAPGNITNADGASAYDTFSIKLATGIELTRIGGVADSRFLWSGTLATMLNNSSSNAIGGLPPNAFGIWQNGTLGASNVGTSFIRSNFNCRNLTIGTNGFGPGPITPIGLVGYICEFIVYTRALQTSEREAMEAYLTQKWAITSNTPIPIVNNLALWLDAADTDMLTRVSQTTNATPYLSNWFDKSGNYQHMRQATLARQPFYTSNSFNGRPAIRFGYSTTPEVYSGTQMSAGNIDFIGGNASATATSNLTVFLVVKNEGLRRTILYATDRTGAGNHMQMFAGINPSSGGVGGFIGNRPTVNATIPPNSFQREGLYTVLVNPSQTASNGGVTSNAIGLFYNGILQGTSTDPNIRSNFGVSTLTLGITPNSTGAFGSYTGYIAEIIVYNATLSLTQRLSIETYLTTKWGLSSNIFPTPFTVSARLNNSVPGPCAWFDASDRESVLLGTGPNAQNNYVQFWYDKSGRAYPMNQGTAGSRPYYDPIGFNGLPTIKFGYTGATSLSFYNVGPAGSSNFLNSDFMSNDISIFCVMRIELDVTNTNARIFSAAGATSGQDNILSGIGAGGYDGFVLYNNQVTTIFQNTKYNPGQVLYDFGSNFIFTLIANTGPSLTGGLAASNYAYYVNGGLKAGGVGISAASFSNYSTTTLFIGINFSGAVPARFSLSECLIYNRALNGAEKSNIENYLTTKWNMSNTPAKAAPYQVGTTATPLYLTMGAWYDANEAATMGLDVANYVQNFYDKSGYGHTLTQANASLRPYYNPVGYNSLPAIQSLVGVTNLQTADNAVTILNGKNAMTFFIVMRHEGSVPAFNRVLSLFSTNTANDNAAPNFTIRHNGTTFNGEGAIGLGTGTLGFGSNFLLTLLINNQSNNFGGLGINSNRPVWYVNGALNSIGIDRISLSTIGTGRFHLGSGQGGAAINGTIGEFLLYTSTLTFADKNNIENYLMTKWSVSSIVTTRPAPNVFFSSLSTWLDTNDIALIRTTDGSNITTIGDKSLNGRSSATSTYRVFPGVTAPTYISTIWTTSNNIPRSVASFNAANRNMLTGAVPQVSPWFVGDVLSNRNMSLFTVGQIGAGSQIAGRIYSLADSNRAYGTATTIDFGASNIGGFAMYTSGANGISVQRNFPNSNNLLTATTGCNIKFQTTLLINGTGTTFGGTSVGPSNSLYSVFTATGTAGSAGVTNVFSNITTSFATSTITSFISTFALGGSALVGAANPTTDMFQGLLGEVVAYARCVTDVERAAIEQYLQSKWF
jgi:hypothetical protein